MAINLKTEENPLLPLKEIEDSGVGGEVTRPSSKASFLIDKYSLILAKLQTADSLQGRIKKIDEEIKTSREALYEISAKIEKLTKRFTSRGDKDFSEKEKVEFTAYEKELLAEYEICEEIIEESIQEHNLASRALDGVKDYASKYKLNVDELEAELLSLPEDEKKALSEEDAKMLKLLNKLLMSSGDFNLVIHSEGSYLPCQIEVKEHNPSIIPSKTALKKESFFSYFKPKKKVSFKEELHQVELYGAHQRARKTMKDFYIKEAEKKERRVGLQKFSSEEAAKKFSLDKPGRNQEGAENQANLLHQSLT
jgi:hypothetical protein